MITNQVRCRTEDGLVAWQYFTEYTMVVLLPIYLIIFPNEISLRNRNVNPPKIRTERYENIFFPYTIKHWKNLDDSVKSKLSIQSLNILTILFNLQGTHFTEFVIKLGFNYSLKLVTFSDLREHRFHHNFNCNSPTCWCGIEDETSVHFFLRYPLYVTQRFTLHSKISEIISSDVTVLPDEHVYHIVVYGRNVYNSVCNKLIITETITYIRNTRWFANLEAFVWYTIHAPDSMHTIFYFICYLNIVISSFW